MSNGFQAGWMLHAAMAVLVAIMAWSFQPARYAQKMKRNDAS
jgi:CP family cyanate transporter-like MFS transporter